MARHAHGSATHRGVTASSVEPAEGDEGRGEAKGSSEKPEEGGDAGGNGQQSEA
jgi:hypothetical protein